MQELSGLIIGQEGNVIIKIPWEDTQINIPLNLSEPKESIIYKTIREMQRQIAELQKQLLIINEERNHYIKYKFDALSDEKAEQRILGYLKNMKTKVSEITLFEISQDTNLPADQIEKIIEKFEKKGKVKWVEE